jgi:hypothetical protein
MSEPTNEPIKLEVQFYDENGFLQSRTESYTGEKLDYYDDDRAHAAFTLYRWLDRGYLEAAPIGWLLCALGTVKCD